MKDLEVRGIAIIIPACSGEERERERDSGFPD